LDAKHSIDNIQRELVKAPELSFILTFYVDGYIAVSVADESAATLF
jgi:hypothetical protein